MLFRSVDGDEVVTWEEFDPIIIPRDEEQTPVKFKHSRFIYRRSTNKIEGELVSREVARVPWKRRSRSKMKLPTKDAATLLREELDEGEPPPA